MPEVDRIGGIFIHDEQPPGPAAITEVPSNPDTLVLATEVAHIAPESLFNCWIDPALLTLWWPQTAEIDPRPGGAYHLGWPGMDWHLRGTYTTFEPGRTLAFTWLWDHDPAGTPTRHVRITFEPSPSGGTALKITHGPYGESAEEVGARAGNLEGWTHFLDKLQHLRSHHPQHIPDQADVEN